MYSQPMASSSNMGGGGESRKISSSLATTQLPTTQGAVRYVEVPVVEEVIRRVPKQEFVEVEKIIPRYEYEWVDRVVEVPQIHYVDRTVEVEQVQEILKHVPRKEYVDVPREVLRHVPKIENVVVEKMVEIPGQVIEVPKPYVVENKVPVARYVDNEVPMVVAQTVRPLLSESNEVVEVEVFEYEPEVVVVDVEVPKPVPSQLIPGGLIEEIHRVVSVPAAQYNSILRLLNAHIPEADQRTALPFYMENGTVPMLAGFEGNMMYPAPVPTAQIQGYVPNANSGRLQTSEAQQAESQMRQQSTAQQSQYPDYPNNAGAGGWQQGTRGGETDRSEKKYKQDILKHHKAGARKSGTVCCN